MNENSFLQPIGAVGFGLFDLLTLLALIWLLNGRQKAVPLRLPDSASSWSQLKATLANYFFITEAGRMPALLARIFHRHPKRDGSRVRHGWL